MSMQPDGDFLKKLIATFLVEAREHAQALGAGLIELEKIASRDAQQPLIETLFREAHSLKGAARAVNAGEIERACQSLESALGEIKAGNRALSAEVFDGLHRTVAVLGQQLDAFEAGKPLATAAPAAGVVGNEPAAAVAAAASTPMASQRPGSPADTVRIATSKLDAIFVGAEELLGVKLAQAERALDLRALAGLVAERDRYWVEMTPLIRTLRQQLDALAAAPARGADGGSTPSELPSRLLALLDFEREQAEAVGNRVADLVRTMAEERRRLDTLVDRLLEDVKKALMLPFATILAGFPKMVRDLARDAGKDVAFDLLGADIEIDKRILEKIKDPLMHLVRNGVDHGIEPSAERVRRQKHSRGRMTLAIAQAGGKVEIAVTDDGAGMDVVAIKAAAVQAGVITPGAAAVLSEQDARRLVFSSGVTTRRQVTAVSGRGLGMAIVQESVAKLGGMVSIESKAGAGTTVRIVLPLTLATMRGTLVRAAHREFVIPTASVVQVLRVPRASIKPVESRDSICLDGTTLALVRLADVLGLASGQNDGDDTAPLAVLVLEHGGTRMAFVVDQVMGEQEMLAKPLGRLLPRVRNLAGATVFSTGRVVPILGVPDLLQAAAGYGRTVGPDAPAETVRTRRLLVVDDSITARTVLQNILESAGYEVKTAPDGAAAFAALRAEPYDLVVSDVEMPRLDGFELTKRIRGEPKWTELPVVLVTARETKEDRERGLDAGANAYIVKSNFDQSNLLEVIGRLL